MPILCVPQLAGALVRDRTESHSKLGSVEPEIRAVPPLRGLVVRWRIPTRGLRPWLFSVAAPRLVQPQGDFVARWLRYL